MTVIWPWRTVRDRLLHRWIHMVEAATEAEIRTVCYISAEYPVDPLAWPRNWRKEFESYSQEEANEKLNQILRIKKTTN